MLSLTELTALRATVETTFDTTCEVRPRATVSDGAGGSTDTWPATGTAIPCSVRPSIFRAIEQPGAGGVLGLQYWDVRLPWGTVVPATARIVTAAGLELEVQAAGVPESRQLECVVRAVVVA